MPGAGRTIILQFNIGERHHQWVTKADLQTLVANGDAPVLALAREFDRETATSRDWREIAKQVDRLVANARELAEGHTRYLVIGRAPLPVFAYLGARMVRMADIVFANDLDGQWQLFGAPNTCPAGGVDDFAVTPPPLGRDRNGRFALSIQCSGEYREHDNSLEDLMSPEGVKLLGTYTIHNPHSHRKQPLTPAELPVVIGHVERALTWIGQQAPNTDSLMLAFGGPAWLAFWIGHRLVPTVCGRFDLPNFVPGQGYRRGLSHPMAKAPWLDGRVRLMFMNAEPDNQTRTRAAKSFDVVQDALYRELGPNGPFEIRYRGAARIREFMRDIDTFKPDILHLHLHGAETGDLAFEDERGETERFEADRFVAMLRATGVRPTLIVLNACYSKQLAPSLTELAECVVAMQGPVGVNAAIEFSRLFYESLGRGNTLGKSLEQGRAGTMLDNMKVYPDGGSETMDAVLIPKPKHRHLTTEGVAP